jgi:hypothetical protein
MIFWVRVFFQQEVSGYAENRENIIRQCFDRDVKQ